MPTWVGDVVMATPALRALRVRFPNTHLSLLIRPNTRDVVRGLPGVGEVMTWRGNGQVREAWSTARALRRGRFDSALLLSNSFRSAATVWLAGIPRRVGYARDGRSWLLTDRVAPLRAGRRFAVVSTVHYYNALVRRLGGCDPGESMELATSPEDDAAVQGRLEGWGIAEASPLVVINPGASFGVSKLWIPERYGEVADRLIAERGAAVVITFGPGERPLAQRVRDAMRHPAFLVDDPPGTLSQLKSLIRRCDLLLNNDTGPRHFAKAFNRRVVTVFGSTDPAWTHTDYPLERVVRIDLDCSPCHQKVCPLGHHRCMTDLTSDMVHAAAVELLDGYSTGLPLSVQTESPDQP
ncbi:MAG TPA: lipopolysaccharide heptosyltransferase II [Phycisphaerae bacterium]|nr:lipopolysaccharide heptosyltransferase II [Phycisphaerae bacterium]